MRGAWLLQSGSASCGEGQDPCRAETAHALLLLILICAAIASIICAFAFFREDKEEQITPLCPQLVVKEMDLNFKMPIDSQADNMTVTDLDDRPICKVAMDWPDPFRPGASGVAATVRLQNNLDLTLATVVARNVAVAGQGLALCRAGCEIFGFVEPEGPQRYSVRHRTGVHLLTLAGDFAGMNVEAINPVGSKVCSFKKAGAQCQARALQHVDAGLLICSVLAAHVHRRLTANALSVPPPPAPTPAPRRLAEEVPAAPRQEPPEPEARAEAPALPPRTGGEPAAEPAPAAGGEAAEAGPARPAGAADGS